MLLDVDPSALGITVQKSMINQYDGWLEVFSSRRICKNEVLGYYYDCPFYENLAEKRQRAMTYRKRVIEVTAETFRKLSNELSENIIDKYAVEDKL